MYRWLGAASAAAMFAVNFGETALAQGYSARPVRIVVALAPGGQREFFLLGPHAPNLTSNEVRLVHRLWLRFSDLVAPDELHHHDIVHFALDEVLNELHEGKEADVVARLKRHVDRNKAARNKPS